MRQRMSQSRVSQELQEQGALIRIARFFSHQAVKVTLLVGLTLALAGSVAPLTTMVSTAGGPGSVAVRPYPWCGNGSVPC
jgi:hypothetical protein